MSPTFYFRRDICRPSSIWQLFELRCGSFLTDGGPSEIRPPTDRMVIITGVSSHFLNPGFGATLLLRAGDSRVVRWDRGCRDGFD